MHVIDGAGAPVMNATIRVGDTDQTTNEKGLATFDDVEGPQTIAVKADTYRSAVWVDANGANVTIPLEPLTPPVPDQATLSGVIPGWDPTPAGPGHIKAAVVFTSQTDRLGDPANEIPPGIGNICGAFQATCTWSIAARTGPITVVAAIVDRDTKGTASTADDTTAVVGWATRTVTVERGVNQSGLELAMVEAGNLETVTVDVGTPPAGLPQTNAIVGIEISRDEVLQIPLILATDQRSVLAPKRTVFGPDATYRLTAIAQTSSGEDGAQSIVLRRGDLDTQLAAGTWLVPPTDVSATRTSASFSPVAGAKLHTIAWKDSNGRELLDITLFDAKRTSVDVPSLVALGSDALTARVTGIAADLDLDDFSLEEDRDLLHGLAAQPATIP